MPQRVLPGLGLQAYFDLGENGWNDEMDTNIRLLSMIADRRVLSRTTSLPGTGSAGDIYIVPTGDTNEEDIAIWDGPSGSEAWVYFTPSEGWMFYVLDTQTNVQFNGSTWDVFSSGGGAAGYPDFELNYGGTPAADEVLRTLCITRDMEFAADFSGWFGRVGTNPASSFEISVVDVSGPTEVGTITIGTGGTFTFATTGGTAVSLSAGDFLELQAPSTPDGSIDSIYVGMPGTYS